MPVEYYPHWYYPDYNAGNGYVMTRNSTEKLLDTIDAYNDYILVTDDLFITGIIASKADIRRHYWKPIDWFGCKDVCDWYRFAVSLECRDTEEMRDFWQRKQYMTSADCFVDSHMKAILFITYLIMFVIFVVFGAKKFVHLFKLNQIRKKL